MVWLFKARAERKVKEHVATGLCMDSHIILHPKSLWAMHGSGSGLGASYPCSRSKTRTHFSRIHAIPDDPECFLRQLGVRKIVPLRVPPRPLLAWLLRRRRSRCRIPPVSVGRCRRRDIFQATRQRGVAITASLALVCYSRYFIPPWDCAGAHLATYLSGAAVVYSRRYFDKEVSRPLPQRSRDET